MTMKWKCSWIQVLWMLALSLVCLFAFASGQISYQQFLANEITEISRAELSKPQDGTAVDKGSYTISEDMAVFRYRLPVAGEYKFLEVELQDLSVEEMPVLYYGEYKGRQRDEQNFVLRDGKNYLYLGEQKINRIVLAVGGGEGTSFSIKKIRLDENVPRISAKKGALLYVLIFLAVCVLFKAAEAFLGGRFQKIWVKPEGSVIQVCGRIAEGFLLSAQRVISLGGKRKMMLRRGIFGFLILYLLAVSATGRLTGEFYPRHVLVVVLLVMAQCVLYYEGKGRSAVWDRNVWVPFLCLALWICIANGMAYKSLYAGAGWFMLLAVLPFGFSVASMERPDAVIGDISYAMAGSFVPVVLGSAAFYLHGKGEMDAGMISGRELLAEYLILLLLAFQYLYTEAEGCRKKKIIFGAGLMAAEIFLIGTRKWVHVLLSVGCLICWRIIRSARDISWKKLLLLCLGVAGALGVAGLISGVGGMEAYQGITARVWQRCQVWQAYLRKLNLFGHDFVLSLAGKKTYPNNTWVSVAYRYGLVGLALYLVFAVRCLGAGFCRWKKEKSSAEYLLLEIQAVCFALGCYSGMERPFGSFLWVAFYLGAGYYLTEKQ